MPAPPPESDPAMVSTCLSVVVITVSVARCAEKAIAYIYFAAEVCPASAEDERCEGASDCIGDRRDRQQDQREEQIRDGTLRIRMPKRHGMGPCAEHHQGERSHQDPCATASAEPPVVHRRTPHVKESEDGKQHKWNRVEQRNEEEIIAGSEEMQTKLMYCL